MKRRQHEATREIPFDLVIEILFRLPAKSLMRFKSVSKHWLSLIISQDFTKRFLRVSPSAQRLYLWLYFKDKNVLLSSSASSDSDGTTMSSIVVDQEATIPAMEDYSFSHVFHGLVCFTKGPSSKIYNTTTRQLVVLPDIEESNMFMAESDNFKKIMYMYHLGHDPVHDRYKVVCRVNARRTIDEFGDTRTFLLEHWVFLLGGCGASRWRKIPSKCPPHIPFTKLLTINGRMHYLACVRLPDHLYYDLVLVSFDISSEEISMLQLREDMHHTSKTNIIEYGGKVAILGYSHLKTKGMMKLWVMEDAEKNMWWSKTLVLHSSQVPIVNKINLRLQGTTRNGEVMFLITKTRSPTRKKVVILEPQNTPLLYIFLYDLQKNHMRKVEIKETPNRYLTEFCGVAGLDDVENLMYL